MWDNINKVKAGVALAVVGTLLISLFMMAMIAVAAKSGKWELVDKWLTMLFTSLVCNAFLGYLYVKTQHVKSNENN